MTGRERVEAESLTAAPPKETILLVSRYESTAKIRLNLLHRLLIRPAVV